MLAFYRVAYGFVRRTPGLASIQSQAEARPEPPLARFGRLHPCLGAVAAWAVLFVTWNGLFDLMTLFREPATVAEFGAVTAGFAALGIGWSWSYTRRTGKRPSEV